MATKTPNSNHVDMADTQIELGDILAFSSSGTIAVSLGRVTGFTPQKVHLIYLDTSRRRWSQERLIDPQSTLVVVGENIMAYILKNSG